MTQKDTPSQRNHPKQLETHNVPTDDMENTNGKNYYSLISCGLFPDEQKGCR